MINYEKAGEETLLNDYMNVSHTIMIVQLAHVFFTLFTQKMVAKMSEVTQVSSLVAIDLKKDTINERLNTFFSKTIRKNKSGNDVLEQIRDLTLAMFNENAQESPSIDSILESLDQITVGKRVVTEDGNNILCSKRKKEEASEQN